MKKIKNYLLSITFLITSLCFPQTIAASCFVCLHNGQCGEVSGWCGLVSQFACVVTCEDCTIAYFNPKTDYIAIDTQSGGAWIFKGNRKIQILGDKCESFVKAMQEKYAKAKMGDKQIQKQLDAEFLAFSRTDNHKVSSKLLELMSNETGLKIKSSNSGDKSNELLRKN
jgi:hypothetical protein